MRKKRIEDKGASITVSTETSNYSDEVRQEGSGPLGRE